MSTLLISTIFTIFLAGFCHAQGMGGSSQYAGSGSSGQSTNNSQPGYLPNYRGDNYTNPKRIQETQALNAAFFQSIGGEPHYPGGVGSSSSNTGSSGTQYNSGSGTQYTSGSSGGYASNTGYAGHQQQQQTYSSNGNSQYNNQPMYNPSSNAQQQYPQQANSGMGGVGCMPNGR
uniref:Uncharacterized protein n=1 Tax=Acrobeloides nanus TaxID=290746 RepID=A0A914EFV3_9BILA